MQEREGYGTAYLPLSALAGRAAGGIVFTAEPGATKPVLVYFYAGNADVEKLDKAEKKMFGNDDLAIATKFYRCVRIDADQIEDPKVRDQYAKKAPSLYILDAKGKTVCSRRGRLSAAAVAAELTKAWKKMYGTNLRPRLKGFNKYLDRLDAASDKVVIAEAKVTDLEKRLAKRDTKRTRKKLEALKEELSGLRAALRKVEEEREQLIAPPVAREVAKRR